MKTAFSDLKYLGRPLCCDNVYSILKQKATEKKSRIVAVLSPMIFKLV